MSLGYIILLTTLCMFCRCIIFKKRDINPICGLIPILNKYKLGTLVGSKRLGLITGILISIFHIAFLFAFGLELWIIDNYAYSVKQPYNTTDNSQIEAMVPTSIANLAMFSKYLLIAIATAALIFWCMLMWRFTIQHDKSPWWILLWAAIPAIPYIYFMFSSIVIIDGKKYVIQKVEFDKINTTNKITKSSNSKKSKKSNSNKTTNSNESNVFNTFKEKINTIRETNRAKKLEEIKLLQEEKEEISEENSNNSEIIEFNDIKHKR